MSLDDDIERVKKTHQRITKKERKGSTNRFRNSQRNRRTTCQKPPIRRKVERYKKKEEFLT